MSLNNDVIELVVCWPAGAKKKTIESSTKESGSKSGRWEFGVRHVDKNAGWCYFATNLTEKGKDDLAVLLCTNRTIPESTVDSVVYSELLLITLPCTIRGER
jgi:hypothetical protein